MTITCTCGHPALDHNHTGCQTCQHQRGDAWWCPTTRFQLEAAHLEPPTPEQVRHYLNELPELHALLPNALTNPTTNQPTRSQLSHSPAPYNLHTAHLLDTRPKHNWLNGMQTCDPDRMGIHPYLHGWCHELEADMLDNSPTPPDELPNPATITDYCTWLTNHLHWAQTRPQWPHLAWGIHHTHTTTRHALNTINPTPPPDPTCRRCHTGHLRPDTTNHWTCDTCGHTATIHLTTLPNAARHLNIGTGTLYHWANTHRFHRIHTNGAWHYDLYELAAAVAQHRLNNPQPRPGRPNNPHPNQ